MTINAKQFVARCSIQEPPLSAEGEGTSRRIAEQAAAAALLDQLAETKRNTVE